MYLYYPYMLNIIYIFVRWMVVLAEGVEAPTACQQQWNQRTKVMRLQIQQILRAWGRRRRRRRKGLRKFFWR